MSRLADALKGSGAKIAADRTPEAAPIPAPEPAPLIESGVELRPKQKSRRDTVALTVHFPERVRRQLKILASEEGRNVDDMVAEGLNLLFARYRKAEIAPRKAAK